MAEGQPAAAFYCGSYVAISVGYNILWHTASSGGRLLRPEVGSDQVVRIRTAYRLGLLIYLGATVASFVSAWLGIAICVALWFVWILLSYDAKRT